MTQEQRLSCPKVVPRPGSHLPPPEQVASSLQACQITVTIAAEDEFVNCTADAQSAHPHHLQGVTIITLAVKTSTETLKRPHKQLLMFCSKLRQEAGLTAQNRKL